MNSKFAIVMSQEGLDNSANDRPNVSSLYGRIIPAGRGQQLVSIFTEHLRSAYVEHSIDQYIVNSFQLTQYENPRT